MIPVHIAIQRRGTGHGQTLCDIEDDRIRSGGAGIDRQAPNSGNLNVAGGNGAVPVHGHGRADVGAAARIVVQGPGIEDDRSVVEPCWISIDRALVDRDVPCKPVLVPVRMRVFAPNLVKPFAEMAPESVTFAPPVT